jgi:hypothetical protein
MNIVGRIVEFNGEKYKVIAQKNMDIVVLENISRATSFFGDVEILCNTRINRDDFIEGSESYYFGVTKADFYSKIREAINGKVEKGGLFGLRKKIIPPINANDTRAIANALHKDYYKVPIECLELIVTAYQNNM